MTLKDIEPLDQIYNRVKNTGMTLKELEEILDNMAKKGSIMSKKVSHITIRNRIKDINKL